MTRAALTPTQNASASAACRGLALIIASMASACSEDAPQTGGAAQSGGAGVTMAPMAPSTARPPAAAPPTVMGPPPITAPPVAMPMVPPTAQPAAGGTAAPAPGAMPGPAESSELAGECPEGFMPKEGENTGFPDPSGMRQFVVVPPSAPSPGGMDAPYPLFISLTGTVESTNQNLTNRGNTSKLAEKGWIVVGPVRQCSSNADDASSACNGTGSDGWNWRPWNEGAAPGAAGQKWYQEEGPDAKFLKSMTKCIATKWKLDAKRLFVGGISSGGTFSNRLLTFGDDFWAGGLPISGEMYLMNPGAVPNDPTAIQDGRCCPVPLPREPDAMDPMIIITIWGGPTDTWPGANYLASTQVFSNYMETQKNVVHLACSATHGHMWPNQMQDAFNAWFADVFYSHPKGTPPDAFKMIDPPDNGGAYSCKLGRYTDHY
jgi:hypothetical protein